MNELQVFQFEGNQVRTQIIDGEPWFVAKDILERLEIDTSNVSNKISHVPEEWKGRYPIATPSGKQEMAILSEQGVYFFLARSDKPKALPMQKWIAGELLPTIRKTGRYESRPLSVEEHILGAMTIIHHDLENVKKDMGDMKEEIRKIEANQVNFPDDYFQVKGYARYKGIEIPENMVSPLGRKATKLSNERGVLIKTVPHGHFGRIGSYHVSILEELFADKDLFGTPL